MRSVLITGASRGIGLEFVRQLCRRDPAPEFVFASCRSPSKATDLQAVAAAHKNVKILEIDVQNGATFAPAVAGVANLVGSKGLNVLINNAGIYSTHSIESVSREFLTNIMDVNLIGPILLTQALLPLIRQAAQNSPVKKYSVERAAVINISSGYGSITENTSGGHVGYRESKAALNMFAKSLGMELQPNMVLVLSLDPGWVQTDMGGPTATSTVQETVSGMLTLLFRASEDHSGRFLRNHVPLQTFEF